MSASPRRVAAEIDEVGAELSHLFGRTAHHRDGTAGGDAVGVGGQVGEVEDWK